MKTSPEELIYLADQEAYMRGMMHPDDHSELRASAVKEWALRRAATHKGHEGLEIFGGFLILGLIAFAVMLAGQMPETW